MPPPLPVSVIIPYYNHAESLRDTIDSVLSQSQPPSEIVIIDDASPIPLSETAPSLVSEASQNVTIILRRHSQNGGAAAARNTGIEISSQPFLAFLDADDTWKPQKLERQFPELQDATTNNHLPVASVTGFDLPGSYVVANQPARVGLVPRGAKTLAEFSSGCWYCPGSTLMVHRSFFEKVGLYDEALRRFEDYELFLRAGRNQCELRVSPDILATINSSPSRDRHAPDSSLDHIEQQHGPWMNGNDRAALHRMRAYFALEQAASQIRRGNPIAGAMAMARSWWHHPRLSAQVIDRWQHK